MRKIITDVSLIFFISIILFLKIDIDTTVYLIGVVIVIFTGVVQYRLRGNIDFYLKCNFGLLTNFVAFLINKYLLGYRVIFDFEDQICIGLAVLLIASLTLLLGLRSNEKKKENENNDDEKLLFREREFDLKRMDDYLQQSSIIGVNGAWGSGKSFLVDHLDSREYLFVKIDLLACNLDEIQTVIINELAKVLRNKRIYSPYSSKLIKMLGKSDFINGIGQIFVRDNVIYSEAIQGLHNDLKKIDSEILIVFEDLDRIKNSDVIKNILSITEKIAGDNIKVIFQYDENNLIEKGLDRAYLEKYIPLVMNVTVISFVSILDYLFEERSKHYINIKREDFKFLETSIRPSFAVLNNTVGFDMFFNPSQITIRKVKNFLDEISLFIEKNQLLYKNIREVIAVFSLKHFFHEIYMQLIPGESILKTFLFQYEGKSDTIINWIRYCKKNKIDIKPIWEADENRKAAFIVSLFKYECEIDEVENNLEEILTESVVNIKKRTDNEQKDRIIWNLLCSGKSELTDSMAVVIRFRKEVLGKRREEQMEAFKLLNQDLFNGKHIDGEKGDNHTIFRMGVSPMVSLFQAFRINTATEDEWIRCVAFYLDYRKTTKIIPELIECLNYCDLKGRKQYLYIINIFNELDIEGNLNTHKSYPIFLNKYLTAMTTFGYIDTEVVEYFNNENNIGVEGVRKYVFDDLMERLEKLVLKTEIPKIKKEINLLQKFLVKNIELMSTDICFKKPEIKVKTNYSSEFKNRNAIEDLRKLKNDDELAFREKADQMYADGEITAYELANYINLDEK